MAAVDESDIIRLIERVIDARTAAAEPLVATVVGVPDTSRFLLARIGEGVPFPVWRPAMPTLPGDGDRISLIRGPEGYLVLDKLLDRDPAAPLLPGGDDGEETGSGHSHTLGLHTALGLATLADITSHASGPGHLVTYSTPNTLDLYDGQWSKLAEGSILEQFGSVTFHAMLNGGGSAATTWTRGTLRGKVLQFAEYGSDPDVVLELLDFADVAGDDLALVVTDNAGPTSFELHARVTRQWEWLSITPLWVRRDRCSFEWTPCEDFEVSLP